ncbi:MAG: helix-turn-helix transcriptional regulator [Lachnospiraceae bacterium]|nr:helix-turn-helix transcriptional regulator [Lachnospiraceae bacterium]
MPPTKDQTMLRVNSKALLLAMADKEVEPKELAANAGVSPNVVYRARRGCYMKPKYIGKIAKALDMNVEDITE